MSRTQVEAWKGRVQLVIEMDDDDSKPTWAAWARASLSPDEARALAALLVASADRCEP